MWSFSILLFAVLFVKMIDAVHRVPSQVHSHDKITVTLSERQPFVIFNPERSPTGLDVLIIQNFAQKFNLKVEYHFVYESLNHVFSDAKYFNARSIDQKLRFVIFMV